MEGASWPVAHLAGASHAPPQRRLGSRPLLDAHNVRHAARRRAAAIEDRVLLSGRHQDCRGGPSAGRGSRRLNRGKDKAMQTVASRLPHDDLAAELNTLNARFIHTYVTHD